MVLETRLEIEAQQRTLTLDNSSVRLAKSFCETALEHFANGEIGRALTCVSLASEFRQDALDALTHEEVMRHFNE
jgi:hypothetical protein